MKNLLLIFLSSITIAQTNLPADLRQEVEEFMKNREQMYNQIIRDNSAFDEDARALIQKLMNNSSIAGLNQMQSKIKFNWERNILWILDFSNEDEIEIKVTGNVVNIQGKHFEKVNNQKIAHNIRQSILIPKDINFKNHKIEFIAPNFKITFN